MLTAPSPKGTGPLYRLQDVATGHYVAPVPSVAPFIECPCSAALFDLDGAAKRIRDLGGIHRPAFRLIEVGFVPLGGIHE